MKKIISALCVVLIVGRCVGQEVSLPVATIPLGESAHAPTLTAEDFLVLETPEGSLHMTKEQARAKLEAATAMAQQTFDEQDSRSIYEQYPKTTIGLLCVVVCAVVWLLSQDHAPSITYNLVDSQMTTTGDQSPVSDAHNDPGDDPQSTDAGGGSGGDTSK